MKEVMEVLLLLELLLLMVVSVVIRKAFKELHLAVEIAVMVLVVDLLSKVMVLM
jgi:hypothetical protein